MSQATIPPVLDHAAGPPADDKPRLKSQGALHALRKWVLEPVASLRLTVILFSLSLFLVFAGTLAQAESGNVTVINQYFRSPWFVWMPFQIFVKLGQVFFGLSPDLKVAGAFPFPGGWLLGGALLTNLLVAHALRFRVTIKDLFILPLFALSIVFLTLALAHDAQPLLIAAGLFCLTGGLIGLIPLHGKRSGILILHAGVVVMMLSEFVTGKYAVEGFMVLGEGDTSSIVENHKDVELAITDRSDPKLDNVVVIPEGLLRKRGLITHPALPFDVYVDRYLVNSQYRRPRNPKETEGMAGDGKEIVMDEMPEVSGTSTEGEADIASVYVTIKKKGTDEQLGKYLVSLWFDSNFTRRQFPDLPQLLRLEDGKESHKEYHLALRPKRSYRQFTVRLLEFRHDRFQGEDRPRNFSSLVRLTDPTENEDREVKICMNHPLRYAGETFYQAGFLPGDRGTVLQVVRNPGWLMPYISCLMVALGMMIHFGLHLHGFLRKRGVL